MAISSHPLDSLSPSEISSISLAVKSHVASKTKIKIIKFLTANILLPSKLEVLSYLGIIVKDGQAPVKAVKRTAETDFVDLTTGESYNARLILTGETWTVTELLKLPIAIQPQITPQELIAAEETVRNDPRVQKLAKAVGLEPHQIFADGWSIGYDSRFPEKTRLQQCLLYAKLGENEGENIYAHPLDFFPVIDSNDMQVIHIDFAAHRSSAGILSAPSTAPPPILSTDDDDENLSASGRKRISPPTKAWEYLPDLLAKLPKEEFNPTSRPVLKPLHIVQPEGVSFIVKGNVIEWQNWSLHAAFSHREGIALSTITYNDAGEIRPILYRLSLVEMVVPYAAPEHPHPRKFAFDVGEYGMGTQANELSLGCDCLGTIHYLPGTYIGNDGSPVHIKRAICIHEEDAGILWKHTDFRPGGRVHSVRSRRLVISMICTVANYEYCFYYYFFQDGGIELEIRLTGIVNAYLLDEEHGEKPDPFGTRVAPGINAQYHQHIFSIRIDPMIDGLKNSVVETDLISYPYPTGSKENHAGNAFVAIDNVLKNARADGERKYDGAKDRRWRIVNPTRKHYASGKEVGYTVNLKGATVDLLAKPDSWAAKRAGFARSALWVVHDRNEAGNNGEGGGGLEDERMYPAGRYVPQTRDDPVDSVVRWSKEDQSIHGEDILVFATIGINHIPRPEDWPVMPSEHLRFSMRPVHFFKANPALDIASGIDNMSISAFPNSNSHDSNSNCCD